MRAGHASFIRDTGSPCVRALRAALLVILLSATPAAAAFPTDGFSYAQPAAQLVMPFDATEDRVTFALVSNIGGHSPQTSTRWTWWSESCERLADFAICLTMNDTVVVDPRRTGGVGPANEPLGPAISLDGERGLLSVTAYATDAACRPWHETGAEIADNHLVGTFTVADLATTASFANDALGLGKDAEGHVRLPGDGALTHLSFDFQTLAPASVEDSFAMLTVLEESDGPVLPAPDPTRFAVTFFDDDEIPTRLPDQILQCTWLGRVGGGLIPPQWSFDSSGLVRLQATIDTPRRRFLYGVAGASVGPYGQTSKLKFTNAYPP